jgi:hypothetical protein
VLGERHQQDERFGEDQHSTAGPHTLLAQMASPLRILSALTKIAAQNCTARLPAKTSVSGACHGYTANVE